MKHKLIMENWRKYLAEQEQSAGSRLLSNDPKQREFARLIAKDKETWKKISTDRETNVKQAVADITTLLDPTGLVGEIDAETGEITPQYELVKRSADAANLAWKKGEYISAGLNSVGAALGALAMIPIAGKLAKAVGKTAKLTKTTKKTIDNSKQIKLELDSIPAGQRTPELNDAIRKLDTEIAKVENLTPMVTKRTSTYINDLTRKIKGSVMSKLKSGQVKIGKNVDDATPITFEIPRDVRFDSMTGKKITKRSKVEKIEVRIVASNENKIKSGGAWNNTTREGGYISATVRVPERYLRKTDTGDVVINDPRIFRVLQDKLGTTLKHELTHGAQYAKPVGPMKDRGGKYLKYDPKKDHGNRSYHAYRMQKVEVEPFAVQAAVKPKVIRNGHYDTLDRLVRDISDVYSDLGNFAKKIVDDPEDLKKFLQGDKSVKFKTNNRYKGEAPKIGFARSRREFQLFEKEVKTAQSMRPCAAISATNALLLWDMGLYDLEKTGMNRQIYDQLKKAIRNPELGRKTPVPINPKACSYKSLREWQEDQDSKQILC